MSLSSFFEKRGKKIPQQQELSALFAPQQNLKFKELKEDQNASKPVHLPPASKKEEPENLEATLFVGNVPLAVERKELRKIFSRYGKVEKVWFRSVPVEQSKMGKKAGVILKKFQQGENSKNAYVKFQEKKQAEDACNQNGSKLQQNTLRVCLCLDDNTDYQTTIFIGNLPLDIKEEELRNHFSSVGQITNVRVVRDKSTHKGIGIGYVRFASKQMMFKAIQTMNGSTLKERPLRVKRAVEKSKLDKKFSKIMDKKMQKKGYTPPNSLKADRRNIRNQGGDDDEQRRDQARKFHFKRKMIQK